MVKYNIGDVCRTTEPLESKIVATGVRQAIPKGTVGIVMAEREPPRLMFPNGTYVGLPTGDIVDESYNSNGLAQWIASRLIERTGVLFALMNSGVFTSEDEAEKEIVSCIQDTLWQLGFRRKDNQNDVRMDDSGGF